MEFNIFHLAALLFLCQFTGLFASQYHHGQQHHGGDSNDKDDYKGDYCVYLTFDHNLGETDTMFCPYGCCGDLSNQKCCESPDKDKGGNARLVHSLAIFAGVMLVLAITCCGFGIYKHKKAKLRKTSPGRNYSPTVPDARSAPYAIFYTQNSNNGRIPSEKKSDEPTSNRKSQSEKATPTRINTPPPRYMDNAVRDPELPPYSAISAPPPYSFTSGLTPPAATAFRGSN